MDYYGQFSSGAFPVVPHGPGCECSICGPTRVQNTERLTSTDRLSWLENKVLQLAEEISKITKGQNSMGYALWCQPGSHSFDENDPGAERMTIDVRDEKGKKTGEERTVHVCTRHAADMFAPKPRSLAEITAMIDEAGTIGD